MTPSFTPTPGEGCEGAQFTDDNGLIVIEIESQPPADDWVLETAVDGYTGSGYYRWDGPNNNGTQGEGLLEYTIQVQRTGTYRFVWRSKNVPEVRGLHNDAWLRFPDVPAGDFYGVNNENVVYPVGSGFTPNPEGAGGNNWFKIYQSQPEDWSWQALTNDNNGYIIFVDFDTPGVYTMQISGRSSDFAIDRVVLSHDSINNNTARDLNNAQTLCEEVPTATPSPTASMTLTPTPSMTPSHTPTMTPSPTPSVTPSLMPSVTPSPTPSMTPSLTPTVIPSLTPTVTLTPSQTPTPIVGCNDAQFEEDGGLIVVEIESQPAIGDWDKQTGIAGYTGSGFFRWTGSNQGGNYGEDILEYKIKVNNTGTYRFIWRSYNADSASDLGNDAFLRFPDVPVGDYYGRRGTDSIVYPQGSGLEPVANGSGGQNWFKIFMSQTRQWSWQAMTSDNNAHQIFVDFDAPGIYTMQISGRSTGYVIDRMVLYNTSLVSRNEAENVNNNETLCQ